MRKVWYLVCMSCLVLVVSSDSSYTSYRKRLCRKYEVYNKLRDCKDRACAPQRCSQLGYPVTCDKRESCVSRCLCRDGYLRGADGACVPKDQCPCERCSQFGYPVRCDKRESCVSSCVCRDGYLRGAVGACVPKDQCPSCGGDPNAQSGCGINCGKTCPTNKTLICPRICELNGCNCKEGYVYDPNVKKCVPPGLCTPSCGSNEVFSSCTNGGCDARYCSQLGKPVPCKKLDPKDCKQGCVCATGYLRASEGTCVPEEQCTPQCDQPNEVFDVCPAPCPPARCDADPATVRCRAPPRPGDAACQPGCRCVDNYARNAKGICVPREQCENTLKCSGPNEVYDSCPPTCPPQLCGVDPALVLCNPAGPECNPACRCIDGYVRDDNNQCIPRDSCPKCTGQNEYYDTCIAGCSNQTCDSIGKNYSCPIQTTVCRTGCRCQKGFYRNSDNVCVPESECPPQCGPNEVPSSCSNGGCGPFTCSDLGYPIKCVKPAKCETGCVCKNNYVRNENGTCVPKNQCKESPSGFKESREYEDEKMCKKMKKANVKIASND